MVFIVGDMLFLLVDLIDCFCVVVFFVKLVIVLVSLFDKLYLVFGFWLVVFYNDFYDWLVIG